MSSLLLSGLWSVAGRIALSVTRMGAALVVARLAGAESFGAYALLLSLIGLFEWLVDFGQTDMVVRNAAARPRRSATLLGALALAKRAQGVIGALALPCLLTLAGQDGSVVLAGCAGGVAVLATAWLQPARAQLRLALRMDRDVGAELAGMAVMLPLLAVAALYRAPLALLIASFAAGRLVQAGLAIRWAGEKGRSGDRFAAWRLAGDAAPLGVAGLMVLLYDALAPLLLARLIDLKAVALYAAATRFLFPALVAVQAINAAFFPVLSAAWRRDPAVMARTQQAALMLSVAVAACLFAAIHGGAAFLMGLMGTDFAGGAGLLRLMAWLLLARAVTTAMAPLIIVAGRQAGAMGLTLLSLCAQAAALSWLVPRLGVTGAGIGYLAVELLLGTVAVPFVGQKVARVRIDWRPIGAMLILSVLAVFAIDATPLAGTFIGGSTAAMLVLAGLMLLALVGRRSIAPLWADMLRRRTLAEGAA